MFGRRKSMRLGGVASYVKEKGLRRSGLTCRKVVLPAQRRTTRQSAGLYTHQTTVPKYRLHHEHLCSAMISTLMHIISEPCYLAATTSARTDKRHKNSSICCRRHEPLEISHSYPKGQHNSEQKHRC
jgi:hypothetical protein